MLRKFLVVLAAISTVVALTFAPIEASARRGGGGGGGRGGGFHGGGFHGGGFRGGGFRGGGFRGGGFRGARFHGGFRGGGFRRGGFRRFRGIRRGYPIYPIYSGCWRYRWVPTPYGLIYRLVNVCRYRIYPYPYLYW